MARPLEEINVGRLQGVRNRGTTLSLTENTAVVGSKNWYAKAPEEVTGIEGYTLLNSVQTERTQKLIEFVWQEADGTPHVDLLAVINGQLWEIDPDTGDYTLIGGAMNPNGAVSHAEVQDRLYLTTGGTAPVHVYDPIAGTCEPVVNVQPAPPVVVEGDPDLAPSGYYEVKYYAVYDDGRPGYASEVASLSVENAGLAITIPAPVDPTGIVGHDVFVRPPGPVDSASPEYFYRTGFVEIGGPQTIQHEIRDSLLRLNVELQKHGDPPPEGIRHCCHALNRLWVMGWEGELATVRASDPNEPTSFTNITEFRVNPGDNDVPVAIVSGLVREGETSRNLIATVFKRRSIYNLIDTGDTIGTTGNLLLVQIEKTRSKVGTVSEDSIVVAPIEGEGGATQMMFIAPDGTIRAFDGQSAVDISEGVRDYLRDINFIYAFRSFGYYLPRRRMVIWHFPRGQSQHPNFALGYHLETGQWVPYPDWPTIGHATAVRLLVNDERYFMTASEDDGGYALWRQFNGNTFAGSPITWVWRSKPLLTETGKTYVYEYLEPITREGEVNTFYVRSWRGFENPDQAIPWLDTTVSLDDPGKQYVHPIIPMQNADGDFMVDQEVTVELGETTSQPKATLVGFRMGVRRKLRKRFDVPNTTVLKT